MSGIQARKVLSYTLLPGVMPRAKALFASGFGYLAFLLAHIYNGVRLLPRHHPYLLQENVGKYGLRHVIAEAANHLVLNKKNIDQLVIFVMSLCGIVILFLQFAILLYSFILQPAVAAQNQSNTNYSASTINISSMFETKEPTYDIAFMMLDRVFGVPGMFKSCVSTGMSCDTSQYVPPGAAGQEKQNKLKNSVDPTFPTAFQIGLHKLFAFYSTGMLLIGIFIFLYFLFVVVLETATTGHPFGERFQNIWVPFRLVLALGLLVPLPLKANGVEKAYNAYNSAQYIALYAAKLGSGFATNGWKLFNDSIARNPNFSGANKDKANPGGELFYLALPQRPDTSPILHAMSMVHACIYSHLAEDPNGSWEGGVTPDKLTGNKIKAYLVKIPLMGIGDDRPRMEWNENVPYEDALEFFNKGDIVIRFGYLIPKDQREQETTRLYVGHDGKGDGGVEPTCGEVRIATREWKNTASLKVQEYYYDMVKGLWANPNEKIKYYASYLVQKELNTFSTKTESQRLKDLANAACGDKTKRVDEVTLQCARDIVGTYNDLLKAKVVEAQKNYNETSTEIGYKNENLEIRGWGGAGIWYNMIARINGTFISSVVDIPSLERLPLILDQVRESAMGSSANIAPNMVFSQYIKGEKNIDIEGDLLTQGGVAKRVARGMASVHEFWVGAGQGIAAPGKEITGDFIRDVINIVFGAEGLFAMRGENANIHPLAQLSSLGKGLLESTIRNVFVSSATAFMGGFVSAIGHNAVGAIFSVISDMALSTAYLGLTAGFILYYILPFLPFLYFFFAVGRWVKAIFEAMVGLPLWALAHLRIDGEGLPGDAASDGYFLILDIFLRPIMTVMGLIAAYTIFTAQVRILNFLWDIVVQNVSASPDTLLEIQNNGANSGNLSFNMKRSVIDEIFFTVTYTLVVYMMAMSSFKLIDNVPNSILRWAGVGTSTFGDFANDPAEGLTQYAAISGMTMGRQVTDQIKTTSGSLGGQVGKLFK